MFNREIDQRLRMEKALEVIVALALKDNEWRWMILSSLADIQAQLVSGEAGMNMPLALGCIT
jgi:hypothetical protein